MIAYRVTYFDLVLGIDRHRGFNDLKALLQFIEHRIDSKTLYTNFRVEAL